MVQGPTQTIEDFEARLRNNSQDCQWPAEQIQCNLIEQFIAGLHDRSIQQAVVLKCAKSTELSEVVQVALNIVQAQQASGSMSGSRSGALPIDDVKKLKLGGPPRYKGNKSNSDTRSSVKKCYRCGDSKHLAPDCKYKDVKCNSCGTRGHLSAVCFKKKSKQHHYLEELQFHYMDRLEDRSPIFVNVMMNDVPVKMELDSGSGVSTMQLSTFRQLCPNADLFQNDIKLRTATGQIFEPHSYAEVEIKYNNQQEKLHLYLVDQARFPTLFGRSWLRTMHVDISSLVSCHANSVEAADLVTEAQELIKKYPNLTKEGIGKIPSTEMKLHFEVQNPKPVYCRARPVAQALIPLIDRELDLLESSGVVERVNVSDWAHPVVVVPRAQGKKVRICGDFKVGLNQYIKVDDHPLKNIRHALDNIGVGKRFSKLDISAAFLHMPVCENDRKYLVVNTHRGLYKFNRMSNGLSSAAAVWQRYIEGVLADIPGVEVVMDDIVVTAPTDSEHLKRLDTVLSRLNEQDLRLNWDKCKLFAEEITFCGFKIKHQEIQKCADKVAAILDAPTPGTIKELKSFLGLIQFYASFAPQLADIACPLYTALKGGPASKDVLEWTKEMAKAFKAVKDELCSSRVLVPFDPAKPLLLATDASPYGVSAVLSHKYDDGSERPIAYYSRTLTDCEKKYTQIDKEALAIKCGMEKFFYYLFGRRFTLITDSRPLVSIFSPSKALPPLSATRMQNYSMYLTSFNYDIVYRNTANHGNADALSRLPRKSEELAELQEVSAINYITEGAPLNLKDIAKATSKCKELRPLLSILQGEVRAPSKFAKVDITEFTIFDQVIFRGHRVVVPTSCRAAVLKELHDGHFGSKKMKELARRYVWWKGLDQDIEELVQDCNTCLVHANNPPKVFYHNWKVPERSFERVHLDYAGPIDGKYLLLLVDSYSKWLEVSISTNKTTSTTLKMLRETVARFGLPSVIVTDNDPSFVSQEFEEFCRLNGIIHKTSPPYHPASNGQVERYVQTMKQAIKKIRYNSNVDLHTALQQFLFKQRMVMNSTTEKTPAELMIGHQLRSKLDLLSESPVRQEDFTPDQQSKFKVGDAVMVRDYMDTSKKWIQGVVKSLHGKCVCLVEVSGKVWKRHFDQMRKIASPTKIKKSSNKREGYSTQSHVPVPLFFPDDTADTPDTDAASTSEVVVTPAASEESDPEASDDSGDDEEDSSDRDTEEDSNETKQINDADPNPRRDADDPNPRRSRRTTKGVASERLDL